MLQHCCSKEDKEQSANRNLHKAINALAIAEVPLGFAFSDAFDRLNAEIEHYRMILSRKGVGTGGSSSNSSGDSGDLSGTGCSTDTGSSRD